MKPDKEGIWEWFEANGTRRLMSVYNVAKNSDKIRLRVYWWGGYYNVDDIVEDIFDANGQLAEKDVKFPAEWPDHWGNYVGYHGCVKLYDIYDQPTPEQIKEMLSIWKKFQSDKPKSI